MATNIGLLGEDVAPCSITTGEDWNDGLAFLFGGAPVSLDGIAFRLQVRKSASGRQVFLDASTDNGLLQILPSSPVAAPAAPGTNYAVGDLIRAAGGTGTLPMVFAVTAVGLVGLALSAPGTLHAPGDTLALAGGVAAAGAAVTVDTVDSAGRILTFHVSAAGSYSAVASTFAQAGTSGHGSGAAFAAPAWGVAAVAVSDPGIYSALPASPVAQLSTTGGGAGATVAVSYVDNGLAILVPADDLPLALVAGSYVYAIRAKADGYTAVVRSGPFTVATGIVQ